MTVGPLEVLLWVTSAIAIRHCTGATVACLACSYTFAGDGRRDVECVTDVYNHAQTAVVNCTSGRCYTRAVYAHEYSKVVSLSRGCSVDSSDSVKCDPVSSMVPTCHIVCSSAECNGQHGDIWSSKKHDHGEASLVDCNRYLIFASFLWLAVRHVAQQR